MTAIVRGISAIGAAGLRALSGLLPCEELGVPSHDSEAAHKLSKKELRGGPDKN